ncbi:hypothetical protein AHiyo8_00930 [Arthrobacter sp. Hiyo8]|uniref:hypothetical protein n=1 Tax=Arthrobacter sp. Hiyo1 TaxID=1588020 RepID=UPI000683A6C2|nr:hypothetical protein [Arthrobacter sp. Hiyo1]BAS11790.1 hypothetical protein AHiyo8_00930 [Arthrobacter sp. Hiyo8]GAP61287.1 hypothetical protein AHiyo1_49730 [Arthrobacter sp. Hiyo1]
MQPQPDVIVQLLSDSPAWLTPAIAASAAIVSSFLTLLGTRINEGWKAKRADKQRWDTFIIEEAAALQRTCETAHRKMRDGVTAFELDEIAAEAAGHYKQLSIVGPKEVVQAAIRLYGYVLTNVHQQHPYVTIMKSHRSAQDQLTEAIRRHIGLPQIVWEPPNPEDVKVQEDMPTQ